MKVKEIMHAITVVDKNASVFETAKLMSEKEIGSVLIDDEGCIKIVTERDILKKLVARDNNPKKIPVSDLMMHCAHTIEAEKDILDASEMFDQYHIRRLPVTEEGKIIGIITTRDVAKSLKYLSAREARQLWSRGIERPLRY